jgi:hypothetical protein
MHPNCPSLRCPTRTAVNDTTRDRVKPGRRVRAGVTVGV